MKLLESAWDGDIEGVRCLLKAGVPVNVTIFVSSMKMGVCVQPVYTRNVRVPWWLPITCEA